jgi:hydroxyacylglutathione hydrolase
VLDVRRESEWEGGHINGADWYPLDRFKAALPSIEPQQPLAVHCQGGYRSAIACSLLQCAGYNVTNVIGGFDAWLQAQLPRESGTAVSA